MCPSQALRPHTLNLHVSYSGIVSSLHAHLQMYTGCRPWAGLSHRQILSTVLSGAVDLEWPGEVARELPEEQREVGGSLALDWD